MTTIFADIGLVAPQTARLAEFVCSSCGMEQNEDGIWVSGDEPIRDLADALLAAGVLAGRVWIPGQTLRIWSPSGDRLLRDPDEDGYPRITMREAGGPGTDALGVSDYKSLGEWVTATFVEMTPVPDVDGWMASPPCAVAESMKTWVFATGGETGWHKVPWEPKLTLADRAVMILPFEDRWEFLPITIRPVGAEIRSITSNRVTVTRPETVS